MPFLTFVIRTAAFYWRTNLAVVLGVAAAVSVLAGALIVGDSVRGSLRDIAVGRLGRTDMVVSSTGFFRDGLAADVKGAAGVSAASPLIVASGFVTHEASGRRASNVLVYGVDERFWSFNGEPARDGVFLSPALASELGARDGDVVLARVQKPSAIPIESLFGRKEDVARTVRLQLTGTLSRDHLGEFALQPQQAEVRALFAPLRRIQRDLAVQARVNTVLVSGPAADPRAVAGTLQLDDLDVRVSASSDGSAVVVESGSGIVAPSLEAAATKAAERLHGAATPVFTYLANTIRHGDRQIPYSLITATDLSALPAGSVAHGPAEAGPYASSAAEAGRRASSAAEAGRHNPADSGQRTAHTLATEASDAIILNDWAARELQASPGDRIDVDYYLWNPVDGLQTRHASFVLSRVVAIAGLAADRRLAPEYPGITAAKSLADWDPPFPIDLSRVRPVDEQYWDEYRTTPKAFIPYARGRDLWQSRYGALTSMRLAVPAGSDVAATSKAVSDALRGALTPAALGVTMYPARAAALQAAAGATDFGEYFTYFSFFLVVSALLLVVLFFKLGIEQRLRQIGILRASGYTIAMLRRLLISEALVLALAGALIGVIGAVAYGRLIVHALTTWWVGAVGTTLLTLHVTWPSLIAGAAGGALAAILCVVFSLRSVGRLTPRSLLTAQSIDAEASPQTQRRGPWAAILFMFLGLVLLGYGFVDRTAQAGAFFGAGAALLVACLLFFSRWLRSRGRRPIEGRGSWAVLRLGFRSAAFRPSRSVLSAALIAAAAFIIVSVDAFRRSGGEITADPHSGTGGFVLLAQSEIPLLHNPNDAAGRDALLIRAPELARTRFTRFRLRQGQDASCLNLYRPTNPTIIAPEQGFIESNRFTFAASLASTDAERANPWLLLQRRADDGAVPVIADATSLQYVLHAAVGDTFSVDTGADRPLNLRFVGALQDSVLQGQLVMAESRFTELFPHQQGYTFFLIDDPSVHSAADASALAGIVERELEPFGLDAVTTGERLEAFHRVENTYLSTFQALGGLGLLLGTIGLATVMFRNVLERRRELALLRAVGYDARRVSIMIVAEAVLVLTAGLAAGLACAALAVAPAWVSRGGTLPGSGLFALLAAVAVAGLLSSLIATRAAVSGGMLDALRAE